MLNILRVYNTVPYTSEALKLLMSGWKLPLDLDIPCLADDSNAPLETKLKATKEALTIVEDRIAHSGSEAEQILLHNIARLPVIQLRQKLTEEARINMPRTIVPYTDAEQKLQEILYAAIEKKTGSPHAPINEIHGYDDEVILVSATLLDGEGQDHETHGISRILDYTPAILDGRINPKGKVSPTEKTYGKLSFDGGGTFGQVAVQIALQGGLEYMRDLEAGALTVTMRNAYHAGRLEWILRQATKEGYSCLAMFNVGGRVAPEPDGMEPRWGTNPIGIGVSTGIGEDGVVGDIATTARPEGWIRVAYLNGLSIPLNVLRTPTGTPVIEADGLYREQGLPDLLLPLGGEIAAHKGAVLGQQIDLFVDAVSGKKAGTPTKPKENNLVLLLCKDNDATFGSTKEKVARIKSCKTASSNPVRIPGAVGLEKLKLAMTNGLTVAERTWEEVVKLHKQLC